MRNRIWLALGLATLGWGLNGVAVRAAFDQGVPPYAMVAIRSILAFVGVYAYLLVVRGGITRNRDAWIIGAVMSVANLAIPFVLFTLAYQYASAGFVGLLAALIPIGTGALAHFLLPDEPLHTIKVVGLTVALAGVAFLMLSGDSGLAEGGRPLLALGLGVGAVISISFSGVYAKSRAASYDPMELTGMQFALGAIILIVATAIAEGWPSEITGKGWLLLFYLAAFGSVLPFAAYYWVLRHVSTGTASLIAYAVPLISLSAGIVLLDERLEIGIGVGGLLILLGVLVVNRGERRLIRV